MVFYQSPLELRPMTVGEVPKIHMPRLFRILRKSPYALVQWSTRNNTIGNATAAVSGPIVSIDYIFLDNTGRHFVNLDIPSESDGSLVLRDIAECPACSAETRIIYFYKQGWSCRHCSSLEYDSQRRAISDDRSERRADLVADANRLRRSGERVDAYRKRKALAARRLAKLPPEPTNRNASRLSDFPLIKSSYGTQWNALR